MSWSVTDDDLHTPHECVLVNVGDRASLVKLQVIDRLQFNWKKHENNTSDILNKLCDLWLNQSDSDMEVLLQSFASCVQECVADTATMCRITKHSRPWTAWIMEELSSRFKESRNLKRMCRHWKSPANISCYKKFQNDTTDLLKNLERNFWLSECNKLVFLDDNQQSSGRIQPLRIQKQGDEVLFDIRHSEWIHQLLILIRYRLH